MSWNNFGYPGQMPCCVCGASETKVEPRFGYAICRDHYLLSPNQIHFARAAHLLREAAWALDATICNGSYSLEEIKMIRAKIKAASDGIPC